MKNIIIRCSAIVLLGLVSAGCLITPHVPGTEYRAPNHKGNPPVTIEPWWPRPTTTTTKENCPEGFAINEYGDCKIIEPPATTTPAPPCPDDCKTFDAPQAPGPVNDNKTP